MDSAAASASQGSGATNCESGRPATHCDDVRPSPANSPRSRMSPNHSQFHMDHDPPVVDWAPFDLVLNSPRLLLGDNNAGATPARNQRIQNAKAAVHYHALSAGYQVLAPVGAVVGGALHATGLWRPLPSAAATMGASGLVFGGVGALLGFQKQRHIAVASTIPDIPWNDAGIQRRAEALSQNFVVRVLDLSVLCGAGLAAGILCTKGGPSAVGLSPGAAGALQALGLGSAVGGLSALGCIYANKHHEEP